MAQRAKDAGGRVIKGNGPDPSHGVPDPRPPLVAAVCAALDRLDRHLDLLFPPLGPDAHGLSSCLLENGLHFFNGVHLFLIQVGNDISFF